MTCPGAIFGSHLVLSEVLCEGSQPIFMGRGIIGNHVSNVTTTATVSVDSRNKHVRSTAAPYLFILPAAFLVTALFIYSAVFTALISFTDWDGLSSLRFVGFSNYIHIFTDPVFLGSLTNTMIWVIATLVLPVGLGLLMAVGIQRSRLRHVFQNIFYLPYALSATTAGVIWAFLFSSNGLSAFFDAVGLHSWDLDWLNTPGLNTISMIVAYTWQTMGTNMVLFLVGLQAMPKEPLEAARLDGAHGWTLFRFVVFPLLRPFTNVVVLMALVNSFKVFDQIWVMTQGGPYNSSETLAITMYRESFVLQHFGYGSAVAVILSLFVLILSYGYLRSSFRKEGF